jgi:tetratricopeptide (TPR) repeat protein
MRLTPKQRQNQETPEARAEARELKVRAFAALNQGRPAQAMADADAMMAAHVDAGPAGEPYLTARLWRTIALAHLGQHAAAAGEFGRLIEDVIPFHGDKDAKVVMYRIHRAGQLSCLGRYEEGEAESRTAIKQSGKIWPHTDRDKYRLLAVTALAAVLNGRGLYAQAESAARSAIRDARGAGLPAHRLVQLRVALAGSLNGQRRHQEARQILQDLPPGHPAWNVTIGIQLATAELGLGMPGEAEARARETVAEAERLHGPAHYTALAAGTLLGSAIAGQGRHDEARHQLQANAEAWLEHFGEGHPKAAAAHQELVKVSHDAG